MAGLSVQCQRQLELFRRQYLQVQADITFPPSECLRLEAFQQALFEGIFIEGAIEHEPPQRYQLRILKELNQRIETSITDWDEEGVSDELTLRLATFLSSPLPFEADAAHQRSYVTYTLSSLSSGVQPPVITLLEARNLIAAAGTTGFRTWEACLHLGRHLCSSSCTYNIANCNILELGAGTGYLSILCAKYLGAAHVTATDGSKSIVEELSTNFYLNGLQDSSLIEARELTWGQALLGGEEPRWDRGRHVDLILGADVTYDIAVLPSLVTTLVELVELYPTVKILIAAARRNEKTYQRFIEICTNNRLIVEEIDFPIMSRDSQEGPFYWDGFPIELCNISGV